jgi:hypothetical protein
MVLPDSRGIPRAPRYSGTTEGRHALFAYGTITRFGSSFQNDSAKSVLCNFPAARCCSQLPPHNPVLPTHTGFSDRIGLGCCPFAHHYSGNRFCFLFLAVLRCFSSHRYLPQPMDSARDISQGDGLSHSEIPGSKCVCHSPGLIAAYHVLRRQPIPRHPPCTFCILKINFVSRRNDVLHQQRRIVKERMTRVTCRTLLPPAPA